MAYETLGFGFGITGDIQPVGDAGPDGDTGQKGPDGVQGEPGQDEPVRRVITPLPDFKMATASSLDGHIGLATIIDTVSIQVGSDQSTGTYYSSYYYEPASHVHWWRACNAGPGNFTNMRIVDEGDRFRFAADFGGVTGSPLFTIYSTVYFEMIIKSTGADEDE